MGRILIPGGGGTDLDVVTATAKDVRLNKVIVDKDGNPLTGTMAEKGAATYTPNRSNQTIAANQFLTGVQTIKGDTNLLAANIKKGVSIFGVVGTWEGYVAGSGDIYNRGANPGNVQFGPFLGATTTAGSAVFDAAQITCKFGDSTAQFSMLSPTTAYNLTPYSKVNVTITAIDNLTGVADNTDAKLALGTNRTSLENRLTLSVFKPALSSGQSTTISFDIRAINAVRYLGFFTGILQSANRGRRFAVNRIWLS
nr:MAG TPA: tail protein [Caudoviricetes sp.]